MDQVTKDKLALNARISYKFASNWVMTAAGIGFAIYLHLTEAQQQALLEHLPLPAWLLPIIASTVGILARIWPQKNVSQAEGAAKSEDAPVAVDLTTKVVPLDPQPLPRPSE